MEENTLIDIDAELTALDDLVGEMAASDKKPQKPQSAASEEDMLAVATELDDGATDQTEDEETIVVEAPKVKTKRVVRTSAKDNLDERLAQLSASAPEVFKLVNDEPPLTVDEMRGRIIALPKKAVNNVFNMFGVMQGGKPSIYLSMVVSALNECGAATFQDVRESLEAKYPRNTADPKARNVLAAMATLKAVTRTADGYQLNAASYLAQRLAA